MHFKIFVKDIQDGGRCVFGAQIVAQTRDIFAIWKSVPISNINHCLDTFRVQYEDRHGSKSLIDELPFFGLVITACLVR